MKKVGLMTCFLDNYGACLQAYALSRVINELGSQCTIIRYTEPEGYYSHSLKEWLKSSAPYNMIRCAFSRKYRMSYQFGKIRRKAFARFRDTYLPLSDEEYPTYSSLTPCPPYDYFVCGSDQIWNPMFYGKCHPAYYLDFVPPGARRIAYAPSIGVSDIPAQYVEDFSRYLSHFDAVSVRESMGTKLVEKYAHRKAQWVLDPTMLLDGSQWSQIAKSKIHKKPYIFCYFFGNQPYYKEAVTHLQNETGYDVVIIPFSERDLAKEYHRVCKAGPIEFLELIKNAEYILTDSFHASVFSILFGRPFYTLLRNANNEAASMNSRIYSLLSMIGQEERLVSENHILDFPVGPIDDYESVNEKIAAMRAESIAYLKAALEAY